VVETLKLLHTPDDQQEDITLLSKSAANMMGVMFQVRQQQDGSFLVLYISPGCWELCEIEPEKIQADLYAFYNLVHPQDLQNFIESITVAVNTLIPWCWEGRIITKSGKVKWVKGIAQIVPQATSDIIWYGLFMDTTTHKQVERELAEATAQLHLAAQRDRLLTETLARIRSSLKFTEILQITVTEVRQFLQVDRVFIGLNDDQLGARTVAESVDPQYPSILGWSIDDPVFIKELKSLFASHRVRVVEDTSTFSASAKLKAHYQLTQTKASLAVPIILEDELLGVLIAHQCSCPRQWQTIEIDLLTQMSEQLAIALQHSLIYEKLANLNSNLENQVEERTAQLQQKMQELSELHKVKDVVLHTVAHDLRTSVMGNLMVLQHLLNGQKLTADQNAQSSQISVPASILERMIQGNEYQLGMLDSLLEIHCCEKQGIILNCQSVQFSSFIDQVITELQPLFCRNQASIKNLVVADLPSVMLDPTHLKRVLTNLFTHSLQQNPPGLNFTVKTKVTKGMLRVQIQDHGIAISKPECDRLFDLYIRDPQAPCSTSIGLKMYLCKQIIQAHQGEIGATTNQQSGLTFWFTLPLATTA
jgi:signal transduction histidine kinase